MAAPPPALLRVGLRPKVDDWLESTVGGLLAAVGYAQWKAGTDHD